MMRETGLQIVIRRGWDAPFAYLVTGALVALAVSGPVALGLQLGLGVGAGAAVAVVSAVQLGFTFLIAGWLVRRREGR